MFRTLFLTSRVNEPRRKSQLIKKFYKQSFFYLFPFFCTFFAHEKSGRNFGFIQKRFFYRSSKNKKKVLLMTIITGAGGFGVPNWTSSGKQETLLREREGASGSLSPGQVNGRGQAGHAVSCDFLRTWEFIHACVCNTRLLTSRSKE